MNAPAIRITRPVREQVSAEEWEVRVNLAACYRLMAEYGMVEMVADMAQYSPDGRSITFASGEFEAYDLFRKAADGSGDAEQLTHDPGPQHPLDWSSGGEYLAFTRTTTPVITGSDLMILPSGGDRVPYMFLQTPISEAHHQFAPGTPPRWLAYSSDDTGRREIYVTAFRPGQPSGEAPRRGRRARGARTGCRMRASSPPSL